MGSSIKRGPGDPGSMRAADLIRNEFHTGGNGQQDYAHLSGSLYGALCVMDSLNMTPKEYVAKFIDRDDDSDA